VPGAGNILKALQSAAAVTLCVVPGLRPSTVNELASDRLRVATRPIQLKRLLRSADLALMYGGHGVMCAALTAGAPLLVAPHTVEQYLHAKRAEAAGVAVVMEGDRSVDAVAAHIGRILADAGLTARAREFAARHAEFEPALAAAEAAGIIGDIASGRQQSGPGAVSRAMGVAR
jgi:UDP:flavonoid glycosyltransferase YjiC (YdhE family)